MELRSFSKHDSKAEIIWIARKKSHFAADNVVVHLLKYINLLTWLHYRVLTDQGSINTTKSGPVQQDTALYLTHFVSHTPNILQ